LEFIMFGFSKLKMVAVAGALVVGGAMMSQPAQAGGRVSVGIGFGGGYYPAPVYQPAYAPPVVYSQPAPYYYAPAPSYYYQQPTVVYSAPPAYYPAPVYYDRGYYSPFNFSFGFGDRWGGGHWGGHEGGWGRGHR
jgi:hypothetical protein